MGWNQTQAAAVRTQSKYMALAAGELMGCPLRSDLSEH